MKNRMKIILCILVLAISLAGCNSVRIESLSLKKHLVAPYKINESEEFLLKSYGITNGYPIEYNAPKETTSIEISTYELVGSEWSKTNSLGLVMHSKSLIDNSFRGLISCQTDGATDDFVIHVKIASEAGELASFSTLNLENHSQSFTGTSIYLMDQKTIEIGKEIPIAIYQYSTSGEFSHEIEDFFEPKEYSGVDLVQAVTIRFIG